MARILAVIASMLSLLLPAVAIADGNADEAELHFQIAAEHYRNDEYRTALEHFLISNRLVPNKNVVFNIARTYEKLGRYTDAHRYFVDAGDGETDPRTRGEIDEALARITPNVAVLNVRTDPPGANIFLERKDLGSRGRSPRPLAVAAGSYRVIAELNGYRPAVQEGVIAKLGETSSVTIELVRIVGKVKVAVKGAGGADVRVGDEHAPPSCTAPCELSLPPGSHLLYFTHKGYRAPPRQVAVVANTTVTTVADMTPRAGRVVVEAEEHGAIIEVDGKAMGFTPAVLQNVPVGRRSIRVSMRGFKPFEKEITVREDKQTELLDIRLEPLRQVNAVSRYTQNIDDAPSSLTVIELQELKAFGYPTVADALRGVRGVYLSDDRAYESAGIRGVGEPNDYGNRVLILSDGLVLNDSLLNSSYIGTDGRVDLHDIERIEVVRGPGSMLYGTGAFSGVINLVPRARDNPSSVHFGFGTYGNSVARARSGFHYNFADDAGIWASVSGSRSSGFDLPVQIIDPAPGESSIQTAHQTDRFVAISTAGRGWWGPLNAQWSYHQRKQRIPVGALGTEFDDPDTTYLDRRVAGELRFERPLVEWLELFTRVHANHYHYSGEYQSIPPDQPLSEDYNGTWFGGETRFVVKPYQSLRISVGGELQYHPEASMVGREMDDSGNAVDPPYLDESEPFLFGAVYALLEGAPVDWFSGSAGVRLDVYPIIGPIVVPRGALIFKPTTGGVLKVMSGRAFRAPSIYEQYYNDGGYSQYKGEDPARGFTLGPESTISSEIEYSQRFAESWIALASVHTSYIEGIINTVSDDAGAIRYANSDSDAITIGGDVELRHEWRKGWMLSAFYGYQRARFLDDPSDNPRFINAPEHLSGIKGVAPLVPPIASLGARAALEAPRRIATDNNDTTDTAVVADVTLSGFAARYGIRYVIGVYNLFDWQYSVPVADASASRTITQNGRTFLLDISTTFP